MRSLHVLLAGTANMQTISLRWTPSLNKVMSLERSIASLVLSTVHQLSWITVRGRKPCTQKNSVANHMIAFPGTQGTNVISEM